MSSTRESPLSTSAQPLAEYVDWHQLLLELLTRPDEASKAHGRFPTLPVASSDIASDWSDAVTQDVQPSEMIPEEESEDSGLWQTVANPVFVEHLFKTQLTLPELEALIQGDIIPPLAFRVDAGDHPDLDLLFAGLGLSSAPPAVPSDPPI